MRSWIKPDIFNTRIHLLGDMLLVNEKALKEMQILVLISSGLHTQHTSYSLTNAS